MQRPFHSRSFRNALAAIQEPRDPAPSPQPRLRGADLALPSAEAFERAREHLGGLDPIHRQREVEEAITPAPSASQKQRPPARP
jgi:hypothetical protein